jgi:hypothetical protein
MEAGVVEHDQVALFLKLLKTCAACKFRLERRPENMATLAQLGMTVRDARYRILALTPADYVEGPKPRKSNSSQEAWVFGLNLQGVSVYVKVIIRLEPARCVCVSFHEAERPMAFPYREDKRKGSDR